MALFLVKTWSVQPECLNTLKQNWISDHQTTNHHEPKKVENILLHPFSWRIISSNGLFFRLGLPTCHQHKECYLVTKFHPRHRTFQGKKEFPQSSELLLNNLTEIGHSWTPCKHTPISPRTSTEFCTLIESFVAPLLTLIPTNPECKMRSKPLHHMRTTHHPM